MKSLILSVFPSYKDYSPQPEKKNTICHFFIYYFVAVWQCCNFQALFCLQPVCDYLLSDDDDGFQIDEIKAKVATCPFRLAFDCPSPKWFDPHRIYFGERPTVSLNAVTREDMKKNQIKK